MEQMERIPRPGECYRHFKNKLYQIVTVATHSETGEAMVVYQALYGDFRTYVRPLEMFVSEVDHEKYPDVTQRYRFEKVEPAALQESVARQESAALREPAALQEPNPYLLSFLDAESFEERMQLLREMRGHVSQQDLDSMCVVLDIKASGGSLDEQLEAIERSLSMQRHYDGTHLR